MSSRPVERITSENRNEIMNAVAEIKAGDGAVEKRAFRDAMSRLGAAVNVVTTDGPGGRAGFTASAVCSVTDSPPTLLVCINRISSAYSAVMANQVLCVNALADGHEDLSDLFGGKTPQDDRFAAAAWTALATGALALDGSAVSFDCRISQVVNVSTHDVLICAIEDIRVGGTSHGLIYFARRYHALASGAV
jgi:flavin reductase